MDNIYNNLVSSLYLAKYDKLWENFAVIDITDLPETDAIPDNEVLQYSTLPYDNIVLIQRVPSMDTSFFMVIEQTKEENYLKSTLCTIATAGNYAYINSENHGFTVQNNQVHFFGDLTNEETTELLSMVVKTVHSLNAHLDKVKALKPKLVTSFTNKQHLNKIRKGKPAKLTFTYTVLELKPSIAKPEAAVFVSKPHGSPREHDRRGHWRNLSSGKKVWIPSCKVGDPTKGIVRKTYKVTTSS